MDGWMDGWMKGNENSFNIEEMNTLQGKNRTIPDGKVTDRCHTPLTDSAPGQIGT